MKSHDLDVRQVFLDKEALLSGHFLLSSGLHSETYLQAAKVFQYPDIASKLGRALAEEFKDIPIDVVIAPALGGVLVSLEVARALGVRSLFVERVDGQFQLRRGFEIKKGEKVLVVEDVITTGKSTREVLDLIQSLPGELTGLGCIIDRSEETLDLPISLKSLLKIKVQTYQPISCPLCKQGRPVVKPGSRKL